MPDPYAATMTNGRDASSDLTFVRQDIGLAILGTLTSNLFFGLYLAAGAGDDAAWLAIIAGIAGLFTFIVLWHLGWQLAFPPRASGSDARTVALMVGGGVGAVLLLAAVLLSMAQ